MKTMNILVKYLFRVLPEGALAEGAASVVFTLKGEPMFCETIRGQSTSPYNHRLDWNGGQLPEFDDHHWVAIEPGTQFGFEVAS